jgi:hypothetical protein
MEKQKKNIRQLLSLAGIIGAAAYAAHVVIGGILWEGYNHITQTISELTGSQAPNADFLLIFTNIYGICMIIFSVNLLLQVRQKKLHKAVWIGALLLTIMEITSYVGYSLFPLDTSGALSGFQNIMHMVVTAIVVICTIGTGFFMGAGMRKSPEYIKLGTFILVCAVIITVFGAMTPAFMANNIPVSGLTERINIFTLQICLSVISVTMYHKK